MTRPLHALALSLLALSCRPAPPPAPRASLSVAEAMTAGSVEDYRRALEPRDFSFPADHGSHPGFRTEWWYFTGNLETPRGRRLGYQLTVFRNALAPVPTPANGPGSAPEEGERPSGWATRQAWLAHFAVTDAGAGRGRGSFRAGQRLARDALGLAGAEVSGSGGLRLWVEDWSVVPDGDAGAAGDPAAALAVLRLRASHEDAAVDLRLVAVRPPVLHGDRGLSRKGDAPGAASYYYSVPRLDTAGTVRLGGEELRVRGLSWLDREWSTSALAPDQVGWDWFALQLDDGRDLMLFRLRRRDGTLDPVSSGTLVAPDGAATHLAAEDVAVEVLERWRSPRSGAVYPAAWQLQVPAAGLDLRVEPLVADQELDVGFVYWEGAVAVRGSAGGRGYVELTGYADAAPPR